MYHYTKVRYYAFDAFSLIVRDIYFSLEWDIVFVMIRWCLMFCEFPISWSSSSFCLSADYDLTGQLVWPGAMLMNNYLSKNTEILRGHSVIELGSGVGIFFPLPFIKLALHSQFYKIKCILQESQVYSAVGFAVKLY